MRVNNNYSITYLIIIVVNKIIQVFRDGIKYELTVYVHVYSWRILVGK